jgi:alkylation response protein AidB-like acyl-CoA dehydrogenase/predicted heme/steroid binding protein
MNKLQQEVLEELSQYRHLQAVTLQEISKHANDDDAWVLVDGLVYDITKFHPLHPGGSLLLLRYAGKDATEDFKMMHHEKVLKRPEYQKLIKARLAIDSLDPAQQKRFLAARTRDKWLPFSQPYWQDPRGTFRSPFYTERHLLWARKVRDFVDKEIAPFQDKWDEEGQYPLELHEKGYKAGVIACMWPVEYGGTPPEGGYDAFMDLITIYEICRAGGGIMAGWFLTQNIALPPVLDHGSKEMKESVAREVICGKALMALAVTEPWGGSDVANVRTTAVEDGDFWIINGEKKFITSGLTAKYLTTACRTESDARKPHDALSLILVPTGLPGLTIRKIKTQGWWAGNTTYITFENVKVPKQNLIGQRGRGFRYIMENFNHERYVSCVGAASGGHRVIGECIKFARVRKTFGKPLIQQPVIRAKLADMIMRTEAHFALVEQLAHFMNIKVPPQDLGARIALCKVNGTVLMEFIAREASQIFGGNAYARQGWGQGIERFYREVRVNAIGGGSEEILRDLGVRLSGL